MVEISEVRYSIDGKLNAEYSDGSSRTIDLTKSVDYTAATNGIVMVSDSTGMDGYSEGGSNTSTRDSIAWWAAAYSGNSIRVASTCSVGSWTTTDVDRNWKLRVSNPKIKYVVLGIGLNNIYGATDGTVASVEATLRTWYEAKIKEVLSWGGVPIVQTMFPVGNTYFAASATKRTYGFNHNKWRREIAFQYGVPLLDAETLAIDKADANANPYSAYFQGTGSPHPGKEILRQLGYDLWNNSLKYYSRSSIVEQANQYTANQLFTNPAFTGVGGNFNGGNDNAGANKLPDSVWGWQTASHTTYSTEVSTDSKFSFAGAPVKAPWVRVSTAIGSIPTAPDGTVQSSAQPGLLFFTSGLNLSAGDTVRATAEIEVVTPNTLIGFTYTLQDNTGTYQYVVSPGSAFTPVLNADNSKNHILTASTFVIPELSVTLPVALTSAGMWLTINPQFSGVSGGTGNAVWRVRNVKIYKD